ncbi:hypothetical protein [Absidia glauca]|uniref:Uncharacterized protein n=1 Tax=Absidia glauca TaxID=4829 RepID=A0A168Q065_ABSGL|nr:hypothetical protein [Absidia glauca]
MPMMTYKSGFEPKDARTINTYDEDDDFDDFDDWSLETTPPRPRRRKTGTQALVEFLNTTSPEEFKKAAPTTTHSTPSLNNNKRSSTPFFLRRRNKNKASSSPSNSTILASNASTPSAGSSLASGGGGGAPNTIHRKNYIEIIAHNPTRLPHYYDSYTGAGGSGAGSSAIQALASGSKISLNEPILPTRRDSSLYSASIRSLSIKSPSSLYPKVSPKPQPPPVVSRPPTTTPTARTAATMTTKEDETVDNNPDTGDTDDDIKKRNMVDTMVATCDGMDVIEAGLIQRLKQCQLYGLDKPMDVVTNHLTEEHIRALKVSASVQDGIGINNNNNKKKSRHVQVQTDLAWDSASTQQETTTRNHTTTTTTDQTPTTTATATTEDLQKQLAQERIERQRLEAALELTCDHFEVLSGLAYKKLRELWEEKLRWENACIELNERLLAVGHKNGFNTSSSNMDDLMTEDYQHSDYGL